MNTARTLCSILALLLASACSTTSWGTEEGGDPWLAHDVYFELLDDSPAACDEFIEACWTLAELDGIRFFASGTRIESLDRGVNDLGYDVSLHVFFVDQAAYDAYLGHPVHLALLESYAKSWKSVRVFDSFVEAQYIR